MPAFKKPTRKRKLFSRNPPSVPRIRRSAIMNGLRDHKKLIASTPINPASSETSVLQISPIAGTSDDIEVPPLSNAKRTQHSIDKTDPKEKKSANANKVKLKRLKSNETLVKEGNKHVNSAVKAVADHLRSLSESLRNEHRENAKLKKKKDEVRKNGSVVESTTSLLNKSRERISQKTLPFSGEISRNSLKESLNEVLHKNTANDLAGIEILNLSCEDDSVANRANIVVQHSRCSNLPVRKTMLMERHTQTTDSLEKLYRKVNVALSPLKETEEVGKEGRTAKRKIIETEEHTNEEGKKLKTERKQSSKKNERNKHIELGNTNASLEGHESQSFQLDANGRSYNSNDKAVAEKMLESFDFKLNAASIITISSGSQSMIDGLDNRNSPLLPFSGGNITANEANITSSQETEKTADDLINMPHVANTSSNSANQNEEFSCNTAGEENSHTSKGSEPKNHDVVNAGSSTSESTLKYMEQFGEVSEVGGGTSRYVSPESTKSNPAQKNNKRSKNDDDLLTSSKNPTRSKSNPIQESSQMSKIGDDLFTRNKSPKSTASDMTHKNTKKSKKINGSVTSNKRTGQSPSGTNPECPEKSGKINTARNESPENRKSNTGLTMKLRTVVEVNGSTSNTYSETLQASVSHTKKATATATRVLRNRTIESSESKSVQKQTENCKKSSVKATASSHTQETTESSTKTDETNTNALPKKRGRPKGSRNKKLGRPKESINKTLVLEPHFRGRFSGFVQVQSDNAVADDDGNSCGGEERSRRQRKQPRAYIQSVLISDVPKRKSRSSKSAAPRKSVVQKSTKQAKPKKQSTTAGAKVQNVVEQSASDRGESSCRIACEPGPSRALMVSFEHNKDKSSKTSNYAFEGDTSVIENGRNRENDSHSTESNDIDCENIDMEVILSKSKEVPSLKISSVNKQKNESQAKPSNYSLESTNSKFVSSGTSKKKETQKNNVQTVGSGSIENIDSGVVCSVSKELSVATAPVKPHIVIHESTLIPSSSGADSKSSKVSKSSRKKSVTFTEPPIHSSKNNYTVSQALSPVHSETECDQPINSQKCATDETPVSPQTIDDSLSSTSSAERSSNQHGRSDVLHAVVRDEVVALNWVSKSPVFNTETVNKMAVKYSIRNLKSSCGTSSCGYVLLAAKYKKPWQVSKKQCITFLVQKGKAVVKVQNKRQIVGVGQSFYIPLGAEYTICNISAEPLILYFNKISFV